MDPQLKSKLSREYLKGRSMIALSREYGYSKSTLWYHFNQLKIIRKASRGITSVREAPFLLGTFIGLWAGDGSKFIDRGSYVIKIHLNKKDKEMVEFIHFVSLSLFNKKGRYVEEKKSNQATIIFYSKFLYLLLDKYLDKKENKSLTVRLRSPVRILTSEFAIGFLLGIVLSDGYIKERFVLNSISKKLVNNVAAILRGLGYKPSISVQNRKKYGWFDLHRLQLTKKETSALKNLLNVSLIQCGRRQEISVLKGYNS